MSFYTYILASRRNGTLYTGSTDNLPRRIYEHQEKVRSGFAAKYDVTLLVWFEQFGDIELAIRREKQMKEWKRLWKLRVIEEMNPDWNDLFESLL